MTAYFLAPLPITVTASTGWASHSPASNTAVDHPGLTAKSTGVTASMTVSFGSAKTIDTIALLSNIPANATVTVTATGLNQTVTGFTGTKPDLYSTKTIIKFAAITVSSVTISITVPTGKTSEVQRVVIGKRVEHIGVDQSAQRNPEDFSRIDTGIGYQTVDRYRVVPSWKAKMSFIPDTKYRTEFEPMKMAVGTHTALLFVPRDEPQRIQTEAVFGRFASMPKAETNNLENWVFDFGIVGLTS
ncbi:hypothetical protein [Brevundimonas olei]|uniref:hypothetical protein n=1 Tax=Brevundimonas olei TaxID=657642 RepID=UPI0031DB0271